MFASILCRCTDLRASDDVAGHLSREPPPLREPDAGDPRNDGGESQLDRQ